MSNDFAEVVNTFNEKKCCVIIPTFNNEKSIVNVVSSVYQYCHNIYVVNDGCTDGTIQFVEELGLDIQIIGYENNKGKGYALTMAFRQAIADGFDYAISIDADGQHYASDLGVFLDRLNDEPHTVMIGSRMLSETNISKGSSFANKFSNFWFKVETGISLPDTQSGYRLYPLKPISKMKFFTKKYEFEIEIIVRLAWQGYKVICVPVNVFYPEKEERVSHFRPYKDFLRISILNTILVFLAFAFFLPRSIYRNYKDIGFKKVFKEEVFGSKNSTFKTSLAMGFGVFMGIFPIWGYQLLVGFLLAHIFKINKLIFFIFANISLPPLIPVIIYISYVFGGVIQGDFSWSVNFADISFDSIKDDFVRYFIGAVCFAFLAGTIVTGLSYSILSFIKKRQ